jgi:uroporphyrinogen decarboxylase
MDPRERVESAIRRRPVDRVPCGEILLDDGVVASLTGRTKVGFDERYAVLTTLGMDLVCLPTQFLQSSSAGDLPSATSACWPDLARWAKETSLFPFVLVDGAFGWGTRLMGWQNFLTAVARRSETVTEIVRAVERLNVRLVPRAVESGAMGVLIADDVAHGRGLMVSPLVLREVFLPSIARVVGEIHSLGAVSFFHSDGNVEQVIPDLVEAGLDGLQCIESAAGMDLGRVKARYGDRLCLWGNLDLQELMVPRSREQLARAVEEVLSVGWRDGGLIFGTSSGLPEGVRKENLEMVLDLAHRPGRKREAAPSQPAEPPAARFP